MSSVSTGTLNSATPSGFGDRARFHKLVLSVSPDASGDIVGIITGVEGLLHKVTFDPDAVGIPDNNFDVTIKDEYGVDLLGGKGANLSNSSSTTLNCMINDSSYGKGNITEGDLALVSANTGSAGAIVGITLYSEI